MSNIGFMQGRLSPILGNKIQCFPKSHWQEEFTEAKKIGIHIMEWTLDFDGLYENPLMQKKGRENIRFLSGLNNLTIPSLTGDCFMQKPFWKKDGKESLILKNIFLDICKACSEIGIEMIVVPLVDEGSLEFPKERDNLISFLIENKDFFKKLSLKILFESDFNPLDLKEFIKELPIDTFGINYDIGNSASLGFDPYEELESYGSYITNVHIKDRKLNGTTVPLGSGDANFKKVFSLLKNLKYSGNYILQTARASDGNHSGVLTKYMKQVENWLDFSRN